MLRLVFHPEGLAPRIANRSTLLPQLIERLRHEITVSGDPRLEALHDELIAYPAMRLLEPHRPPRPDIVIPFQLQGESGVLSFISTTTVFGTAVDVTVDELAIESFFPADPETAEAMRRMVAKV